METMRKTITVTDQQDRWIKTQIASGGFANDSEYIRDLIRRDQARHARTNAIRRELIKGEMSGKPEPFNGDAFKDEMVAKYVGRAP